MQSLLTMSYSTLQNNEQGYIFVLQTPRPTGQRSAGGPLRNKIIS